MWSEQMVPVPSVSSEMGVATTHRASASSAAGWTAGLGRRPCGSASS